MEITFSHTAQRKPLLTPSLVFFVFYHICTCAHAHIQINIKHTVLTVEQVHKMLRINIDFHCLTENIYYVQWI